MLVGVVSFQALKVMDPSDPRRELNLSTFAKRSVGLGFFMTFFNIRIYIIQSIMVGKTSSSLCRMILDQLLQDFLSGHQGNGAFVAFGPFWLYRTRPHEPRGQGKNEAHKNEYLRDDHLDPVNQFRKARQLVSELAGEILYATSVLSAIMLFGLAMLFFLLYLKEVLGCWLDCHSSLARKYVPRRILRFTRDPSCLLCGQSSTS